MRKAIVLTALFVSMVNAMSRLTPYEISEPYLRQWHELEARIASRPHVERLTLHPAQKQIIREAKRFNVIACGRRFGKTKLASDLLVETASAGFPAGYFAPTYKFLLEGWRDIKAAAEPLTVRSNDSEHRIELSTGGVIEAWSLDNENGADRKYKAGRSRKYKRVAVDEAALVSNLQDVFDYAIAPTLIDLQGDAWFTSTPSGKGAFYRMYLKGQDPRDTEWKSWQMSTSANPYIPISEIEGARRRYPEAVFKQEYLAEFLEDGGAVFRNITACTFPSVELLREYAEPYHVYVVSCDWAKKEDFSVFTVIDCSTKSVVKIDRFNHVEYMLQIPRLVSICEAFQPVEVVSEVNGNEALSEILHRTEYERREETAHSAAYREYAMSLSLEAAMKWEAANAALRSDRLGRHGRTTLPITDFMVTQASKEEAIQALVLAFERCEVSIPDDPALLRELESFGMERLPSGRFRYAAPDGEHDDIVMSFAEGWSRARKYMSVLAEDERARALSRLDESLRPENLPMNPHPMAEVSAAMWMQEFAQEARDAKKGKGGFMKELGLK